MMTIMKTASHSTNYHQEQLRTLEKAAGLKLEELLDHLGIKDSLRKATRFYVGTCPIHGGDQKSAFNIFHTGYETVGNWRCFTHNCHKHFYPTILGLVRGYLSRTKYGWRDTSDRDKECPFREAVSFLADFCGQYDISSIKIDYEAFEQRKIQSVMDNVFQKKEPEVSLKIPKASIVSTLQVPAKYYLSRGFSPAILEKYNVGLCLNPSKPMYMRAVSPVFDDNEEFVVGCIGRSLFDRCPLCYAYHNPIHTCPNDKDKWKYSKWKNNYGFKAENHLYNYWSAKSHIESSKICIIVEGASDVWRLEESGIYMSVATFGAHLTENQKTILDKSGALALILLTDPDEAGRLAIESIRKMCGNSYSIFTPKLNGTDVGDTSIKLIKEKILPLISEIKRGLCL